MDRVPATADEWTTTSGLIDNTDGWISAARFGSKEEYTVAAGMAEAPLMLLLTLINAEAEIVGEAGFSVGKGWIVDDEGASISHPTRGNIVSNSIYGILIDTCIKKLQINMAKYGSPLIANTWVGLGFHWAQVPHSTPSGEEKNSAMPVGFLGVWNMGVDRPPIIESTATLQDLQASQPQQTAESPALSALETTLIDLAQRTSHTEFIQGAVAIPGVTSDQAILAAVLDASPEGFWAKHSKLPF